MRILVTGRHGQVARSFTERASGHPDLAVETTERSDLDLSEPEAAGDFVRQARPQVVVNAAAYTAVDDAESSPERAHLINGMAAGALAEAARDVGARFIQLSTDYVFDGASDRPYRPEDPVNPLGAYGRSKLEGEERVRASGVGWTIVRTAWVYSPWGRNFVRTMMRLARDCEEIGVVADQIGNPTSALDLAEGILCLLDLWATGAETGLGRTYHLVGGDSASWADFAEEIFAACTRLGLPAARIRRVGAADYPTKAVRPRNSRLDNGAFERDTGFVMAGWKTSLAPIVAAIAREED